MTYAPDQVSVEWSALSSGFSSVSEITLLASIEDECWTSGPKAGQRCPYSNAIQLHDAAFNMCSQSTSTFAGDRSVSVAASLPLVPSLNFGAIVG